MPTKFKPRGCLLTSRVTGYWKFWISLIMIVSSERLPLSPNLCLFVHWYHQTNHISPYERLLGACVGLRFHGLCSNLHTPGGSRITIHIFDGLVISNSIIFPGIQEKSKRFPESSAMTRPPRECSPLNHRKHASNTAVVFGKANHHLPLFLQNWASRCSVSSVL